MKDIICMYLLLFWKHRILRHSVINVCGYGQVSLGKLFFYAITFLTVKIEILVHYPFSSNLKLKKAL